MANPRQRRKSRSGSYRPVHHSRRGKKILKKQPPICGPKVLQESWDKRKTVRQNYEALGLVASLNPTLSGGVERPMAALGSRQSSPVASNTPEASSSTKAPRASGVPKGYGKFTRDEEGNIVDVQLAEEESDMDQDEEPLEDIPDPAQEEELAPWVGLGSRPKSRQMGSSDTHVVRVLEQMSTESVGARPPRFTSTGEQVTLRRLVGKYDEDVEAMARDRKLNPDQRTAGELSRAIKKAGGFAELGRRV
ncbi:hypothetical protein AcW1_005951 [Taiwanofungus camphoratus]|nr:hypothetical protein AcV5_006268 [Antrodia cinnamomea]KAI0950289.1 hypothetical protein AcV7_008805 [Antrodia cinnamomea]KAI0957619.1 hypothetical protein AcW1_005951 [Antrodia cinnamomea]